MSTWWGYRDNASIYDGSPLVTVANPYRLLKANPRVAVLISGGTLVLCTSTMTDRTGRVYGKAVPPDEEIADPAEMVRRAIEWLRSHTRRSRQKRRRRCCRRRSS